MSKDNVSIPAKTTCTCSIRYMEDAPEYAKISFCSMHEAAPDMLEALKAQHDAIDILFAILIELDRKFFPSKSGKPWEAMLQGNAAVNKAVGK